MFAATAGVDWFVPEEKGLDSINARSYSQSLLVDPFHTVGVDVLQLPQSLEGNQYAFVFVDYLTKRPEVFTVPDQTADTFLTHH